MYKLVRTRRMGRSRLSFESIFILKLIIILAWYLSGSIPVVDYVQVPDSLDKPEEKVPPELLLRQTDDSFGSKIFLQ